ncbi:GTA baseplate fiber-binding domain-containing protein [Tsuneonella amylolytica]|uniref:GTA baseplate fiber-binding domain-containing protein n=1 Tax=Tsuneonella amylolytica TaxID=2338327 RepID=UPI000EA91EA4|nr:phage tail protein [Tsuneonella amylolytica]
MATLLLTAVGTMVGGPIGGAIGAIAGRSIDGAIVGGSKREGPRLRELSVTTSSYGQPIARLHGRMRAAGTIVWATDLAEHKSTSGGRKGQPSTSSYSYTTSFAVALSSRPIAFIGRIWADGNLLRGAAGDLKVAGSMRIHTGHGDQRPDPLIAAAEGEACPAFRGCAYVVFEDLALEEFGNRIPALTFEVLADEQPVDIAALVAPLGGLVAGEGTLGGLAGFANEGGPLVSTLASLDALYPLACDAGGECLTIGTEASIPGDVPMLPPPGLGWDEDDDTGTAADDGAREVRGDADRERPEALRYYDVARDYQPGVQRPAGRTAPGRTATIEFPGALAADDARALADEAARRSGWRRDALSYRIAELDPALAPGRDVRVPGRPGIWRIEGWEWRARGVELELVRRNPRTLSAPAGTAGALPAPADVGTGPTVLAFFEAPPADTEPDSPTLFAAASGGGAWSGAALFVDRAGELLPIGGTGRERATMATLSAPLDVSHAILFEPDAQIEVELTAPSEGFVPATLAALTMGANRLLVGGEVVQFAEAADLGLGRWRLRGLLRGRGGTESAARAGHPAGTFAVLLDDAIVALDRGVVGSDPGSTIAAIGKGDDQPVYAVLANPGLGRRPPAPVHPRSTTLAGGGLEFAWTRRARGAWNWPDAVDAPLVEETEAYLVGLGPVDAPVAEWSVSVPLLSIPAPEAATLGAAHGGRALWVRQVGRYGLSDPLLLTRLP